MANLAPIQGNSSLQRYDPLEKLIDIMSVEYV
jgi:hypothetical protein